MRKNNIPLFGLESMESVRHFDFLGFTLQYEMSYSNILNMLDLAGIPLLQKDRGEGDPFIIMGGPCAHSAERIALVCRLLSARRGRGDNERVYGRIHRVEKGGTST